MWDEFVLFLRKPRKINSLEFKIGGEGGIRTPDTLASMPHFECGAFNHSATSPESKQAIKSPNRGRYLTKRDKTDKGREAYIQIYR